MSVYPRTTEKVGHFKVAFGVGIGDSSPYFVNLAVLHTSNKLMWSTLKGQLPDLFVLPSGILPGWSSINNYWCQFSAERQNFKDALFQNYFCFSLLLCIQYATDGSIQLIVVDP